MTENSMMEVSACRWPFDIFWFDGSNLHHSALPDNLFYLLMTASLVLLIGLLDDLKSLGIWPRIIVQIISCVLLLLFTDTCITSFGSPSAQTKLN